MKSILLFTLALTAMTAFGRTPKPILSCKSLKVESGTDTRGYVYLTGFPSENAKLGDAEISGAFSSDRRDLAALSDYKPTPKYAKYNKFEPLEDAWRWFFVLLPKDYAERNGEFRAYIQVYAEEIGYQSTITLKCSIN